MGRKTWNSLPVKPLKGRLNCVVSRDRRVADHSFHSFGEAVRQSYALGYTRVYAIGGAAIYEEAIKSAERLVLTRVDLDVPDADAWFPGFDERDWSLLRQANLREEGPRCQVFEYLRRSKVA